MDIITSIITMETLKWFVNKLFDVASWIADALIRWFKDQLVKNENKSESRSTKNEEFIDQEQRKRQEFKSYNKKKYNKQKYEAKKQRNQPKTTIVNDDIDTEFSVKTSLTNSGQTVKVTARGRPKELKQCSISVITTTNNIVKPYGDGYNQVTTNMIDLNEEGKNNPDLITLITCEHARNCEGTINKWYNVNPAIVVNKKITDKIKSKSRIKRGDEYVLTTSMGKSRASDVAVIEGQIYDVIESKSRGVLMAIVIIPDCKGILSGSMLITKGEISITRVAIGIAKIIMGNITIGFFSTLTSHNLSFEIEHKLEDIKKERQVIEEEEDDIIQENKTDDDSN